MPVIQYIPRNSIDDIKWNRCIAEAANGLLYSKTYYLDAITHQWAGLVLGDYVAVMPLPFKKKWGISYTHQVYYAQFLGITGDNLTNEIVLQFLQSIPTRYRWIDMDLNEKNVLEDYNLIPGLSCKHRHNYHLSLKKSYLEISKQYAALCKRKINLSERQGIQYSSEIDYNAAIQFFITHYNQQLNVSELYYRKLLAAVMALHAHNEVILYTATDGSGKLCAFIILGNDMHNLYLIMGGSDREGKNQGAYYGLVNYIIKKYAASGKIFRFEGSDKPGIAFFNQQFGAEVHLYPQIKINRLPFFLKFLK